ncbi:hypothetical protein TcCL_ESM02423 [Trypanosoma cruzi]|uniref:RRM domain-containing protein n=1 Tax=Trypanosoma cruzi (strain CL Brener) TaxID=353153 RepID=Q4E1Q3_TRYCC|nr:hypothetical protein, conserved [Trypanosoma cruzi]EAN98710.1 hypothetical protein, conserved [Trypanosoma cruzi]RNC59863.1 hypothetical protein TcCL_ESM02423 [Trypanosoma cruzi]|eukprot:XP_820561.1 hypothetical protein [Trypanosoma cruzi strain CL Brener]
MNYDYMFVYVNGEKMGLLEDGRLALYQRFPVGSVLYDPSELPPREVPISADAADYGVTACKLIPYGHYEAYIPEPTTGDLHPMTSENVCVYVTNLPPNTTAEMLGRYFEAFDMVAEADVFTAPSGECTGRGWVVFQDPSKLLMVPPVLEFFPRLFIYTSLSDKIPTRTTLQLSSVPDILVTGTDIASFSEPALNHNRGGNHRRMNGKTSGNFLKISTAANAGVINTSAYYFVALIRRDEVEKSVEEGVFWTNPANRRAFYATLERGPVIIIFLLQEYPVIFGYARLLPDGSADKNGFSSCTVEWMKHHVFLKEQEMRNILSVPISKMGDGVPLKPEIGESICHLAEQHPTHSTIPERLGQSSPNNGRHVGRGGGVVISGNGNVGGFNSVGGGGLVHSVGDRGTLRSGIGITSLPQPLGTRPATRGGHIMNNRIPQRRRPYNDNSNTYVGYGGSAVPPRKL